jgi:hypothetical protein
MADATGGQRRERVAVNTAFAKKAGASFVA